MAGSLPHSVVVTAVVAANAAAANAIGSFVAAPSTASPILGAEQTNNIRLMAVYDHISQYLNGGARFETSDLIRLCYSLAKGIECSITLNDIPGITHHLPPLIKKVYEWRKNASLQSAIMMVLISIKYACRKGWFQTVDSEELLFMVDEFCSKYCTELCPKAHVSHALDTISKIMPRFYPGMMLCSLILSFEAKPGYDVLMSDFHFPKKHSSEQMMALIVVKTENLEISSCIATPPQVSFLINGKGVEKRNNVSLDHGPQFPTDISKMLKYGINVLQAIGYFDGMYLIAVAYVSKNSNFTPPALKDYAQPVVAVFEFDSEIIEGSSRIKLTCPISFGRIKTPVKGHLCKHHQCFDYDNFLEMNSRRPIWRCPHCNQPVCIIDMRIDRNMVKILEETGDDVAEVVIHADGSWNVVNEQGRCTDHDTQIYDQAHNMECEMNRAKVSQANLVDLTMEEDDSCDIPKLRQEASLDAYGSQNGNLVMETEDRKPFIDVGGILLPQFHANPPLPNYNSNAAQAAFYQLGNNIRPTFMQSYAPNGSVASAGTPHMPNMTGNLGLSDSVSPVVDQNFLAIQGLPAKRSDTDRITGGPLPRHSDRIPVAVQAHGLTAQALSASRRVHSNVSPRQYLTVNPSTTALENFNGGVGNMDMQQVTRTAAETSGIQNPPYLLNEVSLQQVVGLPSTSTLNSRSPSAHRRGPSDLDALRASMQPSSFSRHTLQTPPGFRMHHPMNQSTNVPLQSPTLPSAVRQPSPTLPSAVRQPSTNTYGLASGNLQSPTLPSAIRQPSTNTYGLASGNFVNHRSQGQSPIPAQFLRPLTTTPANSLPSMDNSRVLNAELWRSMTSGGPSSFSRVDGLPELPSEQNWRPAGRMRGSLTGSDYSAVISHYMAPSAPSAAAAARAPMPSQARSASDQVSVLIANNLMAHGAGNHPANSSQDNIGAQQGDARM